ncbi:AfsR/SARP family transcriptional regulator [Saccharothrix deserti]|uniref:AfsR/SARP family transcriptional regulator n=1 Tax=Saccharothrix deserti TaxID=2593674 RepID=UPI00131D3270|nr:BTAD domain-containing putative transcriptional regulator [Saccharothrix deserti]
MDQSPSPRIQLCGRFAVEVGGRPVEGLRGRQCRPLLGYLVLHRPRPVQRSELVDALWGEQPPPAADSALSALLSNLRHVLGWELSARSEVRLRVPDGTFVDAEAAVENVHSAEAALHTGDMTTAYATALIANYITRRTFLPGFDAPWIERWRRLLADVRLRAVEAFATAALAIGGSELAGADRATRELVELAPYRESAQELRMRVLSALGNTAEALLGYEAFRHRLRDDLGVDPGTRLQAAHRELLTGS